MANDGENYNLSNISPQYGNIKLVDATHEKNIKNSLSFSFAHFKQIPLFQLGECNKDWYIGLIERLGGLGNLGIKGITDNRGSKALRFHTINWAQKNIPIQRKDLNWLPKEILDNENDFPIVQISISKSSGRILGYFDVDSLVFNIVLLDPKHNAQPSKKKNYQIQPTTKGLSQYDELLNKLDRIKNIVSKCPNKCVLHNHIQTIDALHDNIVYIGLDNDFYTEYQEILNEHSLKEILESGVIYLLDSSKDE